LIFATWGFFLSLTISLAVHHQGMTDTWVDPPPGQHVNGGWAKVGGFAIVFSAFSAFSLAVAATYGINHPKEKTTSAATKVPLAP
jgi:hypothetical protein